MLFVDAANLRSPTQPKDKNVSTQNNQQSKLEPKATQQASMRRFGIQDLAIGIWAGGSVKAFLER